MSMTKTKIQRGAACEALEQPWGRLTWFASEKLGNCEELTLGQCRIKPGMANPMHSHPNCTEVLHVLRGKIRHIIEDGKTVELNEGDTITLPASLPHRAENIGETDAVLMIAFSSGDRQVKGE